MSGGHTQLVIVNSPNDFNLVGTTLDDAAGEAFDKSGKLLGFEYPAGPKIDKKAKDGDPSKFKFTKPNVADLDFSFSGFSTRGGSSIRVSKASRICGVSEHDAGMQLLTHKQIRRRRRI